MLIMITVDYLIKISCYSLHTDGANKQQLESRKNRAVFQSVTFLLYERLLNHAFVQRLYDVG
jgi:hypothetical protein